MMAEAFHSVADTHVKARESCDRDILQCIEEIEERIERAEPKVQMIFLEAARGEQADEHAPVPPHIG